MKDVVFVFTETEVYVNDVAFDGQFLEISVVDKGVPVPVLIFIKKFREQVPHLDEV